MVDLLPVVAVPRSGSNLALALLHAHPAYTAASHAASRAIWEDGFQRPATLPPSLYAEGGPYKDPAAVRFIVLDKVPPTVALPESLFRLVWLRRPAGILASRHRYHLRYRRDRWAWTDEREGWFRRTQWEPLLRAAAHPLSLVLWLEDVVEALPPDTLRQAFARSVSACCRAPFAAGETDHVAGAHYRQANPTPAPTACFVCSACGTPTVGYGGFNPYTLLDKERANAS